VPKRWNLSPASSFTLLVDAEDAVTESRRTGLGRDALEHLDSLYNVARHLTGNDEEAEDLVQETFTRALGAESSFTPGNLRAWLFRILRNAYVDRRRRARTTPRGDADAEVESAESAPFARQPLFGDAELEALRGVVAEQIEDALRSLSEPARTVVLLDLEGFTEPEIAEVLGCAQGTVKSRLARAREALRQKLQAYRGAGRGGER
jgi:RNA polymerase sigma-70 factor (ECF subfamily)